jgi:hypothetical protein
MHSRPTSRTTPDWHPLRQQLDTLPPLQVEAARALARNRLTALETVLPAAQRLLPLPRAAEAAVLRQRYTHHDGLLRNTAAASQGVTT